MGSLPAGGGLEGLKHTQPGPAPHGGLHPRNLAGRGDWWRESIELVLILSCLESQKQRGCVEHGLEARRRQGEQTGRTENVQGFLSVSLWGPRTLEVGQQIYSRPIMTLPLPPTHTPLGIKCSPSLSSPGEICSSLPLPMLSCFCPYILLSHYLILKSYLLLKALGKDRVHPTFLNCSEAR